MLLRNITARNETVEDTGNRAKCYTSSELCQMSSSCSRNQNSALPCTLCLFLKKIVTPINGISIGKKSFELMCKTCSNLNNTCLKHANEPHKVECSASNFAHTAV